MSGAIEKIRPTTERRDADEPVREIIEALQLLLTLAQTGAIRSIGVVTETKMPGEHSTGCGSLWHRGEGGNIFTLLGGVSALHNRVASATGYGE